MSSRRVAIDVEARTRALTDPPAWSAELAWLLGVIATDGNLGLVSLGLTPRKSLTLGALAVPDELFPDFFRGCIDGDSSASASTRSHSSAVERDVCLDARRRVGTGRQCGLKIRCPQGRRGSSPLAGTTPSLTTALPPR